MPRGEAGSSEPSEGPRRVVGGRPGVLEVDEHVRQLVLDRLEGADLTAELQSRLRVVHRQVEQMLCGADLFDGEQCRADLWAWVITRSASAGPASSRPGARSTTMVACGRVRSIGQQSRCAERPVSGGHRIQADAAGPVPQSAIRRRRRYRQPARGCR